MFSKWLNVQKLIIGNLHLHDHIYHYIKKCLIHLFLHSVGGTKLFHFPFSIFHSYMLGAPRNTVNSDILHHAEGCLMTDCECYIWHTQYHSDPIWMPWIPVTHLSDISGAPKNADKSFAAFSTDPKSPIKMFPHSVNKIKLYFTLAAYLQCLTGKKD